MDPAEELVALWLKQEGFFVMPNVHVGHQGKEIDFLALEPKGRKLHVEVHASVKPLGRLRPWGPAKYGKMPLEERIKHLSNKKFVGSIEKETGKLLNNCVQDKAAELFGTRNYGNMIVLGVLHRKDPREEVVEEFKKKGVKVRFIGDILNNIEFLGPERAQTVRLLQLIASSELTEEARDRILGKVKKAKKKSC